MIPDHLSTFYDSAWEQWNDMIKYSPAPRIRREKLIRWLSRISPSSLLDVGCGNGEFLVEIRRTIPAIELTGADISPAVIETNRARFPDMQFYELDLNREALPVRFNVVVCMEVLEHCSDYRAVMQRLAAMTEKYLIITVPCGPLFEIDRRVGHVRHFKSEEIEEALINWGLKVIKIQEWGFPFFNLYKHVINLWPDKMSDSFLSGQKYGFSQKLLASATYAAFKLNVPKWGYQMFVLAGRF